MVVYSGPELKTWHAAGEIAITYKAFLRHKNKWFFSIISLIVICFMLSLCQPVNNEETPFFIIFIGQWIQEHGFSGME